MKRYYNLYLHNKFIGRTQLLSVAKALKGMGWEYQSMMVLEA